MIDTILSPIKIYIGIGIMGILVATGLFINYQSSKIKKQQEQISSITLAYNMKQEELNTLNAYTKAVESTRDTYLYRISENEKQINDLSARVNSGSTRLYVKANCPATTNHTTSSGVQSETKAELSGEARQAYFDLRQGIIDLEAERDFYKDYAIELVRIINKEDKK